MIGEDVQLIDVDLPAGEQKTKAFLERNSFGQVPVIDDAGTVIADSNAILVYLATKYADESWYPRAPKALAEVQKWLSVAAALDHERAKSIAYALFDIVEGHFATPDFLLGDDPTIADIAAYAYIAHVPEGDVSLDLYPQIRTWLRRIEALPGFVPMEATKVAQAA